MKQTFFDLNLMGVSSEKLNYLEDYFSVDQLDDVVVILKGKSGKTVELKPDENQIYFLPHEEN